MWTLRPGFLKVIRPLRASLYQKEFCEGIRMLDYEVPEPILNSPYDEPAEHWNIEECASPGR